eukprot:TRINITY_DN8397_c0_g1_i4.p1 TRINITY_DN8397_c0_g1~~TRINITY_DN8397_c0_g1_i4.p1  ORF type:complete len:700 (+),score=109.28 TRINITY_DN8397_c0_g1_i4:65-2164(+)
MFGRTDSIASLPGDDRRGGAGDVELTTIETPQHMGPGRAIMTRVNSDVMTPPLHRGPQRLSRKFTGGQSVEILVNNNSSTSSPTPSSPLGGISIILPDHDVASPAEFYLGEDIDTELHKQEFEHLNNTITKLRDQITRLAHLENDQIQRIDSPEARERLERLHHDRDEFQVRLDRAVANRKEAIQRIRERKTEIKNTKQAIDDISELSYPSYGDHHHHQGGRRFDLFFILFSIMQVAIMVLYWLFVDYEAPYDPHATASDDVHPGNDVFGYYLYFIDVSFMMYIGFGYLMTFLRRYGFGSLGFCFLLSALAVEWGVLCLELVRQFAVRQYHVIHLNMLGLIDGNFAAVTILISFGALIGKTSPLQMVFLVFFEIVFYALAFLVCALKLQMVDVGGSIAIHTFGAFFGLSASYFLSPKIENIDMHKHKTSRYSSDIFAMIGTVFLWVLWPSFNAGIALHELRYRVIMNTVLALIGSCVTTFVLSRLLRPHRKFDMVDVQNATLAGGVAVGCSADLVLGPGGALLLGMVAGGLSTTGFCHVSAFVEKKFGIQDTCGILNLHGLPGILGAVASAVVVGVARDDVYGGVPVSSLFPHGANQGRIQIYSLLITLAIAIGSGALMGFTTSHLFDGPSSRNLFEDSEYWHVSHDYGNLGANIAALQSSSSSSSSAPSRTTASNLRTINAHEEEEGEGDGSDSSSHY